MKLYIAATLLVSLSASTTLALDFNSMLEEGIKKENALAHTLRGESPQINQEREKKLIRINNDVKQVQVESGDVFKRKRAEIKPEITAESQFEKELLGLSELE